METADRGAARPAIMATAETPLEAGRWAPVERRPGQMVASLCLAAQWQGLARTHRSRYRSLALARLGFRD